MVIRSLVAFRAMVLALVLALSIVVVDTTSAQETSPVGEAAAQVTDTVEDEGGFDDWGLLGLLGLAGLAGLLRRPQPVVHTTDRTTGHIDQTRR